MTATFGRRPAAPKPVGNADIPSLLKQLSELSAGDQSVLREGAARPHSEMTTTPDSPNDRLWSQMEALGWMISRVHEIAVPNGPTIRLKMFAITDAGRARIAELLSSVSRAGST
jgi:hypothetical protein